MSKVAKKPITVPNAVTVDIAGDTVSVKGGKGAMTHIVHSNVSVSYENDIVTVDLKESGIAEKEKRAAWAQAGTVRALIHNMVIGVDTGFEKTLLLQGVGYRAELKANVLHLKLGFSHDVVHPLPDDVQAKLVSQTEITLSGVDKQRVGQVAADIRRYRVPEPYKGKGILYKGEHIVRKEVKKK